MTRPRLPYDDDASTPAQMATDARAVRAALHLPAAAPATGNATSGTATSGTATSGTADRRLPTPHPPFAVTDDAAALARRFSD